MSRSPGPWITPALALMVLAMAPLSAWGVVHGIDALQADRRMRAAGQTADARVVGKVAARPSATRTSRGTARPPSVRYVLLDEPGRVRSLEVDRAVWDELSHGQRITVQVDPANPDRHVLDRSHVLRMAWLSIVFFGLLLVGSVGLFAERAWALRKHRGSVRASDAPA